MATMTEILPDRKAGRQAVKFTPAEGDFELNGLPVAGSVAIEGKRNACEYLLTEFPSGWDGRGFRLDKMGTGGTDPTESGYSVFCSRNGAAGDSCECKGFTRWGHCRHADAVRAMLANGWV